jgi:hypothetical protein
MESRDIAGMIFEDFFAPKRFIHLVLEREFEDNMRLGFQLQHLAYAKHQRNMKDSTPTYEQASGNAPVVNTAEELHQMQMPAHSGDSQWGNLSVPPPQNETPFDAVGEAEHRDDGGDINDNINGIGA